MVNQQAAKKLASQQLPLELDIPEEELNWCTVKLSEVIQKGQRIEASVFDIEGRHARETLEQSRWPIQTITGDGGIARAYHRPRFKRIWVGKEGIPIYQPSQILEVKPEPSGHISSLTKTDIDALRVHKGQVLLTCSGTIGNCAIVTDTLDQKVFSHDLIRINLSNEEEIGFLYTFLRTKIGQAIVQTNEYGAVVSHIEPHHLDNVVIPNPPNAIKNEIHSFVWESYKLRDESNQLLDKANELLYKELKLPRIDELDIQYFDDQAELRNYSVNLSQLDGRLDGSYYIPIVNAITEVLERNSQSITTIGDPKISKNIILPGWFKRYYVEEGQGTVFFGGKQLYHLDPSNKKYLSTSRHKNRIIEELYIQPNMIMITCSGTIGKIMFAPEHWKNWTANQHIIRVVPASKEIAGYLYTFLSSDYGRTLIKRFTYGAVVDEINDHQVAKVSVPLLRNFSIQQKINQLALEANILRSLAYYKEQTAIRIMHENVFDTPSISL